MDISIKTALYKAGNIVDAEDIVQETFLAALIFLEKGGVAENPKSWLSSVFNRKYYDFLRRKYRKPVVCFDVMEEQAMDCDLFQNIEKSEEAENIRRCLAMLGENYREVMVRFYVKGQKISQISMELNIPLNTVKSRLFIGRRHIEKEFEMSMGNYAKQSYEPETLWIGTTGRTGLNGEPWSLVGTDKIKMNLLISAYEKPLTVTDLAGTIGIPTAYVEPIVETLVNGELMRRVSDKVCTDFIIYTEKDQMEHYDAQLKAAEDTYREAWEIVEKGLRELKEQDYYKAQRKSAQGKLESFFVIRTVQEAVHCVRDEACGGRVDFSEYADRPNGGKWYAMGNRYSKDYDCNKSYYIPYSINGEWGGGVLDFLGTKFISLNDSDTKLCHAHSLYNEGASGKESAAKMLYAVHKRNWDAFSAIDKSCLDKIDEYIDMGYLSRDTEGNLVCEIPVISDKEREINYQLCNKYSHEIAEKVHDRFMALMEKPLAIPSHVKGYLNWERYDLCCTYLPMMIILKAKENGLYLKDTDKAEAAVYMSVQG